MKAINSKTYSPINRCSLSSFNADMVAFAGFVSEIEKLISGFGSGKMCLLAVYDPMLFAASLLACWRKKNIPIVIPDFQAGVLDEIEKFTDIVLFDEQPVSINSDMIDLSQVCSIGSDSLKPDFFQGEKTAIIMFTSGTTGKRKKEEKTFRMLFEEVDNLESAFGYIKKDAKRYSTVSHFHIYGLLFNVLWPMKFNCVFGGKRRLYWEEILQEAQERDIVVVSSPAHLRFFKDVADIVKSDFKKITIFSSGAPLSLDVALAVKEVTGEPPIEVLGSTETGGIAVRRQQQNEQPWFYPFKDVKVQVDEQRRLMVKSPWQKYNHEWMLTGDMATLDEKRFLLLGRWDSIVKIAGKRVSLVEMEELLCSISGVSGAKVVQCSIDSEDSRSSLAALIEHSLAEEFSVKGKLRIEFIEKLKKSLLSRFEPVTIPKTWRFVKKIPANSQGKTTLKMIMEIIDNE